MTELTYRYVPHWQTAEYEELGWQFAANLGPPHGCYSALYVWAGEGEPIFPVIPTATKEAENVAVE